MLQKLIALKIVGGRCCLCACSSRRDFSFMYGGGEEVNNKKDLNKECGPLRFWLRGFDHLLPQIHCQNAIWRKSHLIDLIKETAILLCSKHVNTGIAFGICTDSISFEIASYNVASAPLKRKAAAQEWENHPTMLALTHPAACTWID